MLGKPSRREGSFPACLPAGLSLNIIPADSPFHVPALALHHGNDSLNVLKRDLVPPPVCNRVPDFLWIQDRYVAFVLSGYKPSRKSKNRRHRDRYTGSVLDESLQLLGRFTT